MLGIALSLLSAAISGLAVVVVSRNSRQSTALKISIVVTAVGSIILWPMTIIANEFSAVNFEGIALFALGGMLSPGLVRLFYYRGLRKLGTSVNSAVFAIYPLYSSLLAVLLLSEFPTFENWVGVFTVVIGVVFVEFASCNLNGVSNRSVTNLIFPILGGLTLGVSIIIRKFALNLCNAPVLGVAVAYTFSFIPFLIMIILHKPIREGLTLKQDFRLFWIAGVGQAISWVLSFYALSIENVAIVAPVLSIEPIFVVILSSLYLKDLEKVCFKLILGVAITVIGTVLVIL